MLAANNIETGNRKAEITNTTGTVYLPGLNGLRAIAALSVVVSHTTRGLNDFGLNNKILGTFPNGDVKGLNLAGYGVTIFFTLSGFLITFLLLKEKEKGPLKIKNFYFRRMLRIWPLYYLYFFACVVTYFIYNIPVEKSSVPFYIFLAANVPFIAQKTLPFLAHYWSLGVEEQFYLFFPQMAKRSNKKLLQMTLLLILILLLLKLIFWIMQKRNGLELPLSAISVTRFHIMLIGVAGAILYYHKNRRFLLLATNKFIQVLSWGCIFFITINKFHLASVIDNELVSVISVFLIIGQITRKNNIINLENKVCDFIGKISYGIYVIHPLIIFYCAKLLGHFESASLGNYIIVYVLVISTTIIMAFMSYEFYEKRFLKLKARFTTVKSADTASNS